MTQSFQKALRTLITLATSGVLTLGGMAISVNAAGQTTTNQITLSNPVSSASSSYVIKFTAGTGADIRSVKFQWATTPSGSVTRPANQALGGATLTAATYNGSDVASFSGATPTINNATGQRPARP